MRDGERGTTSLSQMHVARLHVAQLHVAQSLKTLNAMRYTQCILGVQRAMRVACLKFVAH